MKIIKRYATATEGRTIAAGVYTAQVIIIFDVMFNLTLVYLAASVGMVDSVTTQALRGTSNVFLRPNAANIGRQNPGLISPDLSAPGVSAPSGDLSYTELHVDYAAGETVNAYVDFFLGEVTANIVSVSAHLSIGYLCPEDYLSVDAFAVHVP